MDADEERILSPAEALPFLPASSCREDGPPRSAPAGAVFDEPVRVLLGESSSRSTGLCCREGGARHRPSSQPRRARSPSARSTAFTGAIARVLAAAAETGLAPTVVTFDPHPRVALGYGVELLATLERRLELFEQAGVEDVAVVTFDHELQQLEPEEFAE